jgi:hypothetical protein
VTEADLLLLLGPKVDAEEARKRLSDAAKRLGVHAPYNVETAVTILEVLAAGTGLVAISARFAKARVLLNPSS